MKKNTFILSMLCAFVVNSFAQTTYDVFTYTEPKGYKKEIKTGYTSYTKLDNKTGTYCVISLYKQNPSTGDIVKDFDNDWKELVATPLAVTAAPQKDNGDDISGWKTISGAANFEFNGSASMATLTTAKRDDANIAILILTNSQAFLTTDVDAFYSSIKLSNPQQTNVNQTNSLNVNSNNTKPTSIIGEWSNTGSVLANYVNSSGQYAGDASSATTISFKFLANNNYEEFFATTTGYKTHTFYYKGIYKINGNIITVTPSFYEHKLNTKLQPDNDPKNKKTKTFTYKFEFITSKNNWGLQFQGDDNNFMLSDFMYKVADATISNNTSTVNNNAPSNNNGIEGVWVSYNNNGILADRAKFKWRIFFKDGKSLLTIPDAGLYNFSNTADLNNYWGTYTYNNKKGVLKSGNNLQFTDDIKGSSNDIIFIQSEEYRKCVLLNGSKLNGSFSYYANGDSYQTKFPYGQNPKITFNANGKFTDEGLFYQILKDYNKDDAYNSAGSGTYELKDFSIILKYSDGRIKQTSFTIPASVTAQNTELILLGRASLFKMK